MEKSFTGLVSETGEHPNLTEWVKAAKYFCLSRKGKYVELPEPKALSKKRSILQNRYYWALLGLLAEYTEYTKEEFHEGFGKKWRTKIIVVGNAELETVVSTSDMTTMEMDVYIENVRAWQRDYLPECYLPTPKEWQACERGEYEKSIGGI